MTLSEAGGVPVWAVVTGVLVPVAVAAFWILWGQIVRVEKLEDKERKEIWLAIDQARKDLGTFQVDAERRFAVAATINNRFDRIEEKLDRVLHLRGLT